MPEGPHLDHRPQRPVGVLHLVLGSGSQLDQWRRVRPALGLPSLVGKDKATRTAPVGAPVDIPRCRPPVKLGWPYRLDSRHRRRPRAFAGLLRGDHLQPPVGECPGTQWSTTPSHPGADATKVGGTPELPITPDECLPTPIAIGDKTVSLHPGIPQVPEGGKIDDPVSRQDHRHRPLPPAGDVWADYHAVVAGPTRQLGYRQRWRLSSR